MRRPWRGRMPLSVLVLVILTSPTLLLTIQPRPSAAAPTAPPLPYKRVQLANTSYANYFLTARLPGAPSVFGSTAAWSGTPVFPNGTYGKPVFSWGSLNSASDAIQARNATATPGYGYSLYAQELGSFYANPRFDAGYIITLQTKHSNTSEASAYIINTQDGTSQRAILPALGGIFNQPGIYGNVLSSSGGYMVGIFNHLGLNHTYVYDSNGNLIPENLYVAAVSTLSGSSFGQVSSSAYQILPTTCSYYSNVDHMAHHYSTLFDPTLYVDVAAGASSKYAYAVIDRSLDKLSVGDCQPIAYQTDVRLVLGSGAVVKTFHPWTTNTSKGFQTCLDVGPCFSGIVGFWNNLLLYQTCDRAKTCAAAGPFNQTLYDVRTGKSTLLPANAAYNYLKTDGSNMLWVGNDGNLYVYDQSFGIKKLTSTPFPLPGLEFYSLGSKLDGGWAGWLNQTNYINFYNIAQGKLIATRASDSDRSAYVWPPSYGTPLFDLRNGKAAWITYEFLERPVLCVYTLSGQNGPNLVKASLDWSGSVSGFLMAGDWIYLAATQKNHQVTQIFALRAPVRPPIIFLPGVAGTRLLSGSNELWPATFSYQSRIDFALQSDGKTPVRSGVQINVGDILRSGTGTNVYGVLLDSLKSRGYTEGVDLFTFPYDWRLDNTVHYKELDRLVGQAISTSGAARVILIAHSMGGLISRGWILTNSSDALRVDSLITIDTPFYGAPKAYYALTMGYSFGNPFVNPFEMKIMAQNSPAAYQLLPQIPFIVDKSVGPSNLTLQQSFSLQYKQIVQHVGPFKTSWVEGTSNTLSMSQNILNLAYQFWNSFGTKDNPTPFPLGAKHYVIIGDGVQTLDGFTIRTAIGNVPSVIIPGHSPTNLVLEPHFGDGDATVPLWSEQISSANQTYYVQYDHRTLLPDISSEHQAMAGSPITFAIVGEILDADSALRVPGIPQGDYSSYISNAYKPLPKFGAFESENFVIHSNATLNVVDTTTGASLGPTPNGGVNDNSQTGSFINIQGVQYVSLRDTSKLYRVLINGTDLGRFALTINLTGGPNGDVSYRYPDVTVKNGTTSQLEISGSSASGLSPPTLKVVTDGSSTDVVPAGAPPPTTSATTSTPGSSTTTASGPVPGLETVRSLPIIGVAAVILLLVGAVVALAVRRSRRHNPAVAA